MKKTDGIIQAYRGTDPYIFVSYSHRNTKEVNYIIDRMQEDGYRVWFDEGIDPGTEWDDNIAQKIDGCSFFIAMLSEEYIASTNCKDELNYARKREKNRVLIYLSDVALPDGLDMRLSRIQNIHKYRYKDEELFFDKLYTAYGLQDCREEQKIAIEPETIPEIISETVTGQGSISNVSAVTAPAAENKRPQDSVSPKDKNKSGNIVKFVIAGIAVLTIAVVVIVLLAKNNNKGSSSDKQGTVPTSAVIENNSVNTPEPTKTLNTDVSPEPTGTSDSTAYGDNTSLIPNLDGIEIKLPISYKELTDMGWGLTGIKESQMLSGLSAQTCSFVKNGNEISVTLKNESRDAKSVAECFVKQIKLESSELRNLDIFKMRDVSVFLINLNDIEKKLGRWNDYYHGSFSDFITYYFNDQEIKIRVKNETNSVYEIEVSTEALAVNNDEIGGIVDSISDDLSDFTFMLSDVCYKLPLAYKDLTDNGWINTDTKTFDDSNLESGKATEIKLSKAGNDIRVALINNSDSSKMISECKVAAIEVVLENVDGADYFKIAKSINLASSLDEIVDKLGTPNYTREGRSYKELIYYFIYDDNNTFIDFKSYEESESENNTIILCCPEIITEKVKDIRPDYLDEYETPKELGNDYRSGNFELDGKVYHFPVPIEILIKDGWQFSSKPASVPAWNTCEAELIKGNSRLDIVLKNYSDFETTAENAVVCWICVSENDDVDLTLPGGMKIGQSKSWTDTWIDESFKITGGKYYYYIQYDPDYKIDLTVDDIVTSIEVGIEDDV